MNKAVFFKAIKIGEHGEVTGGEELKPGDEGLKSNTQIEVPKIESKPVEIQPAEPSKERHPERIFKAPTKAEIRADRDEKILERLRAEKLKEQISKVVKEARDAAL